MTTQPGRPFAVDDEMDADADPAVSPAYHQERGDAESDVIVAEVIDEEPGSWAGGSEVSPADALSADDELPDDEVSGSEPYDGELSPADTAVATNGLSPAATTRGPAGQQGNGALDQQWHDIQAIFVDDPRGSVQLAAQAADAAVSDLVESLRERQTGLRPPPGSASSDPADTEQLRAALRTYRVFCETIRDMAQRLPRVGAVAH